MLGFYLNRIAKVVVLVYSVMFRGCRLGAEEQSTAGKYHLYICVNSQSQIFVIQDLS